MCRLRSLSAEVPVVVQYPYSDIRQDSAEITVTIEGADADLDTFKRIVVRLNTARW